MNNRKIPYFSMLKNEERKAVDIMVFGDIVSKGWAGWDDYFPADVNSYDLVTRLNEIPDDYDVTVHINSNGGSVKEGLAIYNALKVRNVTTICEGFAASAASVVFMGGRRRVMNAASLLFIHQAQTGAEGSPEDLEKAAADLRTITEGAAAAYKEAGVSCTDDKLMEMLRNETWLKAGQALELGFATEVAEETEEPGIYTNSAMAAVAKAVAQEHSPLGQIGVGIDARELAKTVERMEKAAENIVNIAARFEAAGRSEGGRQEEKKKGFFNFGGKK